MATSGNTKAFLCDLCEESDFSHIEVLDLYTKGDPIHICKNCGLVQVLERRTPAQIYSAWVNADPGDEIYKSAPPVVAARHAYVRSFISPMLGRNDFLLDVGGGDGEFASHIDNSASWNLMAEDLEGFQTDFITLNWTLENCGDPSAVIASCRENLKDGGYLSVATGSRILVPFKKPLWMYVGPGQQDMHPCRFSRHTLYNLLAKHGFNIVAVNEDIGSDYLVIVGQKSDFPMFLPGPFDSASRVIRYFEAWHQHTQAYFPPTSPK